MSMSAWRLVTTDRLEGRTRLGRALLEGAKCTARLDDYHADVMGHRVVELTCDALTLLEHR